MQTINVNMTPRASQTKILYCSQDDVGRTATINLLDETGAYEIPSGATVTIRATKPSGLGFEETCAVSGNVATVTFTETMTQEAGRFPAELRIVNGTTVIGTANFALYVEKNPHPAETIDGTQETMQNLTVRMDALEDEVDALEGTVTSKADASTVGALADLTTTAKTSIVAAVNEVDAEVGDLKDDIDNIGYPVTFSGVAIDIEALSGDKCKISTTDANTVYRTGKNLCWFNTTGRTNNGITFAIDPTTKKITVSGTATSGAWLLQNSASVYYYLPAGTYTLSGGSTSCKLQATYYTANGQTTATPFVDGTNTATFTMSVAERIKIGAYVASGTSFAEPETIEVMLVKGSVSAEWEQPDRIEKTLSANSSDTVQLVNGINHLFSTAVAEYTHKIPVAELAGSVDDLESFTEDLKYYDLSGIANISVGGVHTISESDSIDFYNASVIGYRIGTPTVQEYSDNITLTPDAGYRMYMWIKALGASTYTETGWKATAYTIPASAKWAVNVAKVTEDTSIPADLETFAKAIKSSIALGNVKEQVDYVREEVAELSNGVFNSGDICQKYIDRNDILTQMTGKPLFLIYTDIHGFTAYLNRISEYYENNCRSDVKNAICLGDIIYNTFSDSTALLNTDLGKESLLVIGNHDCYDGTTVGGVSATDLYNKFFANVSQWGVVQPTGAAANGYCYYYKDYDSKIRLIVLNEYYWDNTQKEWFENTLSEARTAGLAVIVAQHQGNFTEAEYSPLNDYAFGTKGYSFIRYTAGYTDRRNAVDAFIDNGGEFVGWINGHTHCEQFGTFTVNGRTQLNMTFSNAGQDSTSRIKKVGYSQDCFYYLAVDTTKKYVYVLTVGQDTNKWFKRNLLLCYDYANQTVVEYL